MVKPGSGTRGVAPTSPPEDTAVAPSPSAGTEYLSFIWQQINELQRSQGRIEEGLGSIKGSVDSVKTKVDDLVGWKNRILGGAIVLGAVCTVVGVGTGLAWNHLSISVKPSTPTAQQTPAAPPPSIAAPVPGQPPKGP